VNGDDIQDVKIGDNLRRGGTRGCMDNAPTNVLGSPTLPLPEGRFVGPRLAPLEGVP